MKPIEPFKKSSAKFLESPWLQLVKDINFTPLPNQFNFSTNVTRNYIEVLNRDITNPDDNFTRPQFNKTFNISRVYAMRWDITKNIKADFNAKNDGRVLEPNQEKIATQKDKEVLLQNMMKGGLTTGYTHQANLNVNIPLNKIPLLDFINNTTYKYTTSYQWQRKPFAQPEIGNTINNNQQQTLNMAFNMNTLYNKIPYFKRVNLGLTNKGNDAKPKDDKNAVSKPGEKKDTTKPKDPPLIVEYLARLVMTLKQASITFNQTQGTTLPGWKDSTFIFGTDPRNSFNPGPGFVFGQQNKLAENILALHNDTSKIVARGNFAVPYAHTLQRTYSYQAKVEPFKNFKIDVTGTRTYGEQDGFYIGLDSVGRNDYRYRKITPTQTGNFSISVITIKTAFKNDDKTSHDNATFEKFMSTSRPYYSHLLASKNDKLSGTGGYNYNQQDVVVLAFMDAYAGRKSKTLSDASLFPAIPMPNWSVNYDGIGKLDFLKPIFKSVILTHGYRSTMSIGGFTNNQAFGNTGGYFTDNRVDPTDPFSNVVSKYVINTVSISEQFAPLVKVNMLFVDKGKFKGLGANFELKRDRTTTLSANIPQVMELKGNEMNIGSTYTFPNLIINKIKIQGKPLKSDLQMNLTFSIRQNVTTLHKINIDPSSNTEYQFSQLTNGTNIISIKTSFTYTLTQNINLRFFYDRTINKPVISTSFPTQTTNAGVSLRFVIQ
jgi:cell surface protein SprA